MSTRRPDSDQNLTADPIWPAAVAFDHALDQREARKSDASSTDDASTPLTRELLDTADRLRSAFDAQPSPDFASALRQALIRNSTKRAKPRRDSAPAAPALGIVPLPYRPARYQHRSTIRFAAFLVVAVLLIASVVGGDTLYSNLAGNDGELPIAIPARDQASPLPPQIESTCTAPAADLQALAATVNARNRAQPPDPTPTPASLTGGSPANEAITDGVYATVRQWIACGNEGEHARFLGLYTPDLAVRLSSGLAGEFEWSPDLTPEPATPLPPSEQATIRTLSSVRLLPDGRAWVDVLLEAGDPNTQPSLFTLVLTQGGDWWLIDDIIIAPSFSDATPSAGITAPTNINLRGSAAFSATVQDVAIAGSPLIPTGPGEFIDGIIWLPLEGYGAEHPFYVPAVYLTAAGARIPGVPVLTDAGIGTPNPSECQVAPMPLTDITTYMGPSAAAGQRSAMTYLATGVDLTEAQSITAWSRFEIESAVLSTLREAIACQNAGSFTQSVALYTQGYFQRAGAASYRPDGSESQLATPQPLPAEHQTEILDIGDFALLDDGRVGAVVITAAHTEPIQITAAYVVLAETGTRWLIDDAIPIDSSGDPVGYVVPASPLASTPTPPPATVSAEARDVVEDYFAAETSTPTVAAPTEESQQTFVQPIFPVGATVAVRGNTIILRAVPRTNGEIVARLGPCACAMEVFGPMADSGDALWLPVTDLDTGVSGYVSLDFVLPPESNQLGNLRIGQTVVTTSPVHLRGTPELSATAGEPLPAGTSFTVEATKISAGHSWIMVNNPDGGGVKWIPHDILVAATTPSVAPTPTPSSTLSPTPGAALASAEQVFAIGQIVTITTDSVNFRAVPEYDDANVIQQLESGDRLRITGFPVTFDGVTWYSVELLPSGDNGYVVAEFLASTTDPPSPLPTPTPTPTPP